MQETAHRLDDDRDGFGSRGGSGSPVCERALVRVQHPSAGLDADTVNLGGDLGQRAVGVLDRGLPLVVADRTSSCRHMHLPPFPRLGASVVRVCNVAQSGLRIIQRLSTAHHLLVSAPATNTRSTGHDGSWIMTNESVQVSEAAAGYRVITWADPETARDLAQQVLDGHGGLDIIRAPHLTERWAVRAANADRVTAAVRERIGDRVTIEHSFGMVKWPGRLFRVPWHQDGIDEHLVLDPARSVCAWLALTDAPVEAGGLHVVPGSHLRGYVPHAPEVEPDPRAAMQSPSPMWTSRARWRCL